MQKKLYRPLDDSAAVQTVTYRIEKFRTKDRRTCIRRRTEVSPAPCRAAGHGSLFRQADPRRFPGELCRAGSPLRPQPGSRHPDNEARQPPPKANRTYSAAKGVKYSGLSSDVQTSFGIGLTFGIGKIVSPGLVVFSGLQSSRLFLSRHEIRTEKNDCFPISLTLKFEVMRR